MQALIKSGDVIEFINPRLRIKKIHVAVCIERGWFMLINTNDYYQFSLQAKTTELTFLSHNSFLCCSVIFKLNTPKEFKLIGKLTSSYKNKLVKYLEDEVTTLSELQKDLIKESLFKPKNSS